MHQPQPQGIVHAFLSFLLCGGMLAFPGVVLDLLLGLWNWTPIHYGWGLFVQALFALLGTRISSRLGSMPDVKGASLNLFLIAHLLLAWGGALLYFSWQIFDGYALDVAVVLGFACTGLAVGSVTLLNNNLAFASLSVPRTLNVLNLAYTLGAVLVPALAATLLQTPLLLILAAGMKQSWQFFAFTLSAFSVGLACIHHGQRIHIKNVLALSVHRQQGAQNPSEKPRRILRDSDYGSRPVICAAVVMACYVGTEINLSNLWVPFLKQALAVQQVVDFNFRLASPSYWAGLFASRLLFSLRAPQTESLTRFIAFFGISSALTLALSMGFAFHDGLGMLFESTSQALFHLLLLGSFLSGLFIGSTYSFVLGALTNHYKAGVATLRASALVMQWGVIGAMSLPPAIGFVTNTHGTQSAMFFVLFTQAVFTCAAFIWLRLKPLGSAGSVESVSPAARVKNL